MSTRIEIKPVSDPPVGATLMKTGQTVSFRTGDDGDIEAGRATSFFVLESNNPFSNTDRFTDTLGGQVYTNDIVIDWSTYNGTTVLGWQRIPFPALGDYDWDQAIDSALIYSISTFNTGWRVPNIAEYFSLFNWDNPSQNKINYPPFNLDLNLWSSTTDINDTSIAFYSPGSPINAHIARQDKTNAGFMKTLYIRTFTVSGTILT